MFYIYLIQNKINNKIYIGQTNNPKRRWAQHSSPSHFRRLQSPLYSAFIKYGVNNFTFSILEEHETLDAVNDAEEFFIGTFGSQNRDIGYNLQNGGGNKIFTQETKLKMSLAKLGKPSKRVNFKHTQETKNLISKIQRDSTRSRTVSDVTKKKLSDLNSGVNNPHYGKKHSEEHKRKISEAMKRFRAGVT